MKFKVDENLPIEVAESLRLAGYDALTVLEQKMQGSSDTVLAHVCQQEERIIVTLDLDFADIRVYPPVEYAGILVLRPRRQDKYAVLQLVERLIPMLRPESLAQTLWIVDEKRIRVRD
jgi:predicted nuclease of predicted toxin-antitoxin system